jgi:hypothetical protein
MWYVTDAVVIQLDFSPQGNQQDGDQQGCKATVLQHPTIQYTYNTCANQQHIALTLDLPNTGFCAPVLTLPVPATDTCWPPFNCRENSTVTFTVLAPPGTYVNTPSIGGAVCFVALHCIRRVLYDLTNVRAAASGGVPLQPVTSMSTAADAVTMGAVVSAD